MAFVSPRMSLKCWTAASDPYDHDQLADNFLKIDQHDHSQGRGVQIGGSGIQEGAITSAHIFPGSVGSEIIADESLTDQKLDPAARVPIGAVLDWYCATPISWSTVLPDNWKVCNGATVLAADHALPGVVGDFTLPDLRNAFVLGADPAKALASSNGAAGNNPTDGPAVMGLGGNNGTHSHTVPAHTHGVSGVTVSTTGSHTHTHKNQTNAGDTSFFGPSGYATGYQDPGFASYTSGVAWGAGTMDSAGSHTHALSGTVGTGTNGDVTFNAGSTDGRPRYVGLLKIMKVK